MNTLPIGTRLGEFEIKDLIGEGGFGIVYLAYDHSLDRHVALKEYMPSGMAARTQARQVTVRSRQYEDTFVTGLRSFINEARLLARFDSPSLVKVYRFWEENGTAYMAMPFYDGITLKQAYKEQRIAPDEEWIRALLANMFGALETIHREQCFHRDIAPDNILLLKDGRPLLLDFGAARRVIGDLTQGPTVILKPGFAPIEQYADIPGLRQGAWTDIYALGAVVYYLITGKAPSPAVSRVVHDDMVPARVAGRGRFSDEFLRVIDHALAVKPEHRIQSVPEMRRALNMDGVEARPLPGTTSTAGAGRAAGTAGAAGAAGVAGAGSAARPVPPKAGAAPASGPGPRTGAAGMSGMAANGAARADGATATARQAPRSTPPAPARNMDEEWKKSMTADQRHYPQSRNGLRTGVLAAVLLAAGAGTALFSYRWMTSSDTPAQAAASPSELRRSGDAYGTPATGSSAGARGAGGAAGASAKHSSGGGSASGSSASGGGESAREKAAAPAAAPSLAAGATRTRDFIPPASEAPGSVAPGRDKPAAAAPAPQAPPAVAAMTPAAPPVDSAEDKLWNGAKNTDTAEGYKAYLKRYPKGKYAAAARILLEERQRMDLTTLGEAQERKAAGGTASGNERPAASDTTRTAARERKEAAAQPAPSPGAAMQRPDTAQNGSAAPEAQIAKNTAPAREAPRVESETEPSRSEATRLPEPREDIAAPPAPAAPTASSAQRTYTFPGQTMVGNFSADPVTGLISGTGQIRWDNGDRFEGRLVKGVKEGKGRFVWANGQEYSGDWSGDRPNGRGVLKFANGNRYDGEVRDGQPHGQGTTRFQSGDVYSGNWVRGVLNGRGVLQFATGDRYEGELRNGEPDGQGKTRFRSGDVYVGQWARGKHHGQGRYTWQSGSYWEGEFRDGSQTSNGQLVRAEGGAMPTTASGEAAESSGR